MKTTLKKIRIKQARPAGVSIARDANGIVHISADRFGDTMWGIGYCHATDRTTQILMMRALGQGRVCELLSDSEESLQIDKFFRRANWHNNIEQQVGMLDDDTRRISQAYCDGVNAGLADRKLYVLKLAGLRPQPWTIADSILIMRMTGYLTLAQSQAEVERFFVEMVQAGVDNERLAELFPIDPDSFDRDFISSVNLGERIVPAEVLWKLALPRMMASNNWVVAGSKTRSGKPIMANDPHLEVNRLPNVWYEQHVEWGDAGSLDPGYMVGMGMPGLPGVLIGRNDKVAWGATYTFMDTVDSWVEDCREGMYRRGSDWQAFAERKETIRRKSNDDIELVFYENQHGVLDGDPTTAGRYLTTRWSAAEAGAATLMASLKMPCVSSSEEAMQHLGAIESAWNWVMVDNDDNIAFQMSGLMPQREASWNGFTPAPGWDPAFDWQGYVALEDLPRCLNPADACFVTANQDLNEFGNEKPINMPMGDYRARRIEKLLHDRDDHDVESTRQIQLDVYSDQARLYLDILLPLIEATSFDSIEKTTLQEWDLQYDLESRGAVLFEAFYSALRQQVFGASGFGEQVLEHLSDQTGIFIDFYQNFDRVLLNPRSAWYDENNRDEAFVAAFKVAQAKYTGARWKDVNALPFVNQLFQGKLPKIFGFDTPPIPLAGGRATPRQGQIYTSNGRQTSFAPSVRMVADMSEGCLHTSMAGGPSDNRFSRWYKSGIAGWQKGVYK